jgi:hypothetical protein
MYVMCVCSGRLYLQLFVGGHMSYVRYVCLIRHVASYKQLEIKTNRTKTHNVHKTCGLLQTNGDKYDPNKQEATCLMYVMCVCSARLYLQLFVGGHMSYVRYVCLFGSSLSPVVCRRPHVLCTT